MNIASSLKSECSELLDAVDQGIEVADQLHDHFLGFPIANFIYDLLPEDACKVDYEVKTDRQTMRYEPVIQMTKNPFGGVDLGELIAEYIIDTFNDEINLALRLIRDEDRRY